MRAVHQMKNFKYTMNIHQLHSLLITLYRFIYWGFYVAFNTVQVISRRVVGRTEETSTYSSLGFCTVNCRPTASNYLVSHLRPCQGSNPGLRGGRRECYHSATVAPYTLSNTEIIYKVFLTSLCVFVCFNKIDEEVIFTEANQMQSEHMLVDYID